MRVIRTIVHCTSKDQIGCKNLQGKIFFVFFSFGKLSLLHCLKPQRDTLAFFQSKFHKLHYVINTRGAFLLQKRMKKIKPKLSGSDVMGKIYFSKALNYNHL